MRKESRANIIFFLVLLVLILPGFVILMRKKLAGPTDPAHLPTLIPHQAAYIQPEPVPPRAPRIEPPAVRAWVTRELHDRVDPNATVARDSTGTGAVVSDRFATQLVHASDRQIVLLVWSADSDPLTVTIGTSSGEESNLELTRTWIDVPKNIRHALQNVGYTDPPERIAWVQIALSRTLPSGKTSVYVSHAGRTEQLNLP